jgi:hypothetical protein
MRSLILILIPLALLAQTRAPQIDSIRREQLKADVYFLAGDSLKGRLTGTPEYRIAADYLASRYERLGLKPVSGDSFFHRFDLVLSRLASAGNRLELGTGTARRTAKLLEDFYPLIFSADGQAEGNIAFAGFGITAPKLDWDDYKDSNVAGDIVFVLEGEPGANDPKSIFDGLVTSEYANTLRKTLTAQKHGAAAVVFVNPSHRGAGTRSFPSAARTYWPEKPPHLERYTLASMAERIRIPVIQVDPALVEGLFGKSITELKERAEKPGAFLRPTAGKVRLAAALERTVIEDRSVVGMIEGSDPRLKQEAVLVTAHYDHNGATAEQIFNGADDNASGSAAVLDIAEAYMVAAQNGQRPKRSVIFAIWGSEERCCGPLLGSWAWVENPGWPLEQTVASLNMDMIGRSEEVPEGGGSRFNGLKLQTAASNAGSVNVLGWSFSPDLSRMVDDANKLIDLRILRRYDNNRSNLLRRSDQWPFLQRGVPSLFIHTGLHPDYHTQFDRPERIDYPKMERIARFVYQLSWDTANAATRPQFLERRRIPDPEQ